jgi:hypothetical protein
MIPSGTPTKHFASTKLCIRTGLSRPQSKLKATKNFSKTQRRSRQWLKQQKSGRQTHGGRGRNWIEQQLTALKKEEDRFWNGEADVVNDEDMLDVAEEVEADA